MLLSTKLYLDTTNPDEVQTAQDILVHTGLGGLSGVTTNPTSVIRYFKKIFPPGVKIPYVQAIAEYRKAIAKIDKIVKTPLSIQVIGDPQKLTVTDMIHQARDIALWTDHAVVKLPCSKPGLEAGEILCQEMAVNLTVCYSQVQAAAAYAATKRSNYHAYVSPYVGKHEDNGKNGMDVVANILTMYRAYGDGHMQVIVASIRDVRHLVAALFIKSDIVTVPLRVLQEWASMGFPLPDEHFMFDQSSFTQIPYQEILLENDWRDYDVTNELTSQSEQKFWDDWKSIVKTLK